MQNERDEEKKINYKKSEKKKAETRARKENEKTRKVEKME